MPEPQRKLAGMLPLSGLPPEWTLGKPGDRHLETFNAENLYEKIDGRAESFIQYGVKGMAYTFYHPTGDPSNELQLYVFEMADSLKALGKYGSEKPEEFQAIAVGDQGYTSAGSLLFYAGRYYTQIVSTKDDPKFAAFALDLAKRVAAVQKPGGAQVVSLRRRSSRQPCRTTTLQATPPRQILHPPPAAAKPEPKESRRRRFSLFLPAQGREGDAKYVAQDVFGYSFLSDVFMADYKEKDVSWQGFLRPYRDVQEAKAVLEKYTTGVKKDGAEVKTLTAEGADEMVLSNNIGLVDVVFRKGNCWPGPTVPPTLLRPKRLPAHWPKACQPLYRPSKAVTRLFKVAGCSARVTSTIHDRLLGNVRPQSEPAEQRRILSERLMTKDQ